MALARRGGASVGGLRGERNDSNASMMARCGEEPCIYRVGDRLLGAVWERGLSMRTKKVGRWEAAFVVVGVGVGVCLFQAGEPCLPIKLRVLMHCKWKKQNKLIGPAFMTCGQVPSIKATFLSSLLSAHLPVKWGSQVCDTQPGQER